MEKSLKKQVLDSEAFLRKLEEDYEKSHEAYTEALFCRMVKE